MSNKQQQRPTHVTDDGAVCHPTGRCFKSVLRRCNRWSPLFECNLKEQLPRSQTQTLMSDNRPAGGLACNSLCSINYITLISKKKIYNDLNQERWCKNIFIYFLAFNICGFFFLHLLFFFSFLLFALDDNRGPMAKSNLSLKTPSLLRVIKKRVRWDEGMHFNALTSTPNNTLAVSMIATHLSVAPIPTVTFCEYLLQALN